MKKWECELAATVIEKYSNGDVIYDHELKITIEVIMQTLHFIDNIPKYHLMRNDLRRIKDELEGFRDARR